MSANECRLCGRNAGPDAYEEIFIGAPLNPEPDEYRAYPITGEAHLLPPGTTCGPCFRGQHLFVWPEQWSLIDGCPCCRSHIPRTNQEDA